MRSIKDLDYADPIIFRLNILTVSRVGLVGGTICIVRRLGQVTVHCDTAMVR